MTSAVEVMAKAAFEAENPSAMPFDDQTGELRARIQSYQQAALSALDAAGFVMVPKEPTSEMLTACWPLHHPWGPRAPEPAERPTAFAVMKAEVADDWKAMIQAARSTP